MERRRLIDFLEEGIGRGLAVVSAPAGFGKSTLISRWASRAGMPVAWLSLDSADNDVHRFLLYCAGALDAARAGLAGATADLLGAMPPAPAQAVVASLINAVGSGGTDVALVLDDYQFIRTVDIHEAVRFLVDRKPPLLHLVIATREDPPLPIARLRTQGALTEIRADDLRFTTEEAGLYLNSSMSLSLSVENVALLSRRTEGWIAGLQMAALSLQGRGDAEAFIAAFGGTTRYILDYLAEEVFARQDDETRHFLLQTSVLGRMSAGLCEAVIGKHGAQQMLERLDRANLFLVSLDERRCWFRYHHLFGELLLHRLGQDRPAEEIRGLRIRAGDWLAVNGELPEAIEQYLAAGAFDRAAALIEGSYVEIFTRGVLDELYRWTMRMPEDLTRQRPTLGVVSAWALALAGKREAAETALRAVQSVLERPDLGTVGAVTEGLRGDVAIVQAFLSDLAGDTPRAVELAGISAGLLPGDHWMGRSIVFFILGRAAMYEGDLEGADRIFSDHLRFSVAIDNIWAISVATHFLLVLRRLQGTLHGCERLVREFEAHVDRHHSRDNCTLAKAFAAAADWMREQGRLREAEHAVSQAVRQAKEWGVPADIYYCLYFQARVQRSLGQIEEAVKSLESAQAILQTARVATPMQTTVDAERVRCWLAVGDVESAVAWAGQWGSAETLGPLSRHVQRLSVTRVNLAAARSTDELDQELAALDEVGTSVRERQWKGLLLDTQLLLAAARCRRFGPAEALDATDEAVRLAYTGDFFQTIVEEGSPIEELLRTGLDAGRWTDPPLRAYVERILRAI